MSPSCWRLAWRVQTATHRRQWKKQSPRTWESKEKPCRKENSLSLEWLLLRRRQDDMRRQAFFCPRCIWTTRRHTLYRVSSLSPYITFWCLEWDIALEVKVTNRFLDLLFVRIYFPLKAYCFYVIKLFLVIFNHHKTTIKAKVLSNG